jgi:hypothetical protein
MAQIPVPLQCRPASGFPLGMLHTHAVDPCATCVHLKCVGTRLRCLRLDGPGQRHQPSFNSSLCEACAPLPAPSASHSLPRTPFLLHAPQWWREQHAALLPRASFAAGDMFDPSTLPAGAAAGDGAKVAYVLRNILHGENLGGVVAGGGDGVRGGGDRSGEWDGEGPGLCRGVWHPPWPVAHAAPWSSEPVRTRSVCART